MRSLPGLVLLSLIFAVSAVAEEPTVDPGNDPPVRVDISVDVSDASTRFVIGHDRKVPYVLRASSDRVEIVYTVPVELDRPERLLDDPIVSRIALRGDRTLVFDTGSAYRNYDSFELQNPFRLVLDLQGARPRITLPETRHHDEETTVVVIDPGHGGIENGAVGPGGLREKDVALDLARRLKQVLQSDRDTAVVLTRDQDRLVGLDERTAIANHNRADLFVSIHLNSSPRRSAVGAETYFLASDATDDEARTVAALENRSHGVTRESLVTTDGDARDLELVLWDMAQNQFLAESSLLAERIQGQLNRLAGTRDRGVRQAPFRVLMGATMPAVLVEVGFISNPKEEERLRSPIFRNQLVHAVANAVREYLRDLERLTLPGQGGLGASGRP